MRALRFLKDLFGAIVMGSLFAVWLLCYAALWIPERLLQRKKKP